MSCKQFLYAIVSLVLLMHIVAAAPTTQSPGTPVAQALITAATNAGYTIDPSQIQTVSLPNGGSVANYALVDTVDASNPLQGGVPVALQYWASADFTGFVVVTLTSASQQALQFTLLDSTNKIVGTQTVPTSAAANPNPARRDVIIIRVTLCVRIFGWTICISWTVIIITPVVPRPTIPPPTVPRLTVQPVTVQPVTVQPVTAQPIGDKLGANRG